MRRIVRCAAVLVAVVGFSATLVEAGPGRPATAGARAQGPKVAKANGSTVKVRGPKTVKAPKSNVKATGATAKGSAANAGRGKSTAPGQMKKNPATQVTDGTTVAPVTPGPNVPKNPKLQARLQAMLPQGMTLDEAAAGFKNQGQFIAAVHASTRLGVEFQEIKVLMVDQGSSLGQAIQTLKPGVDAEVEANAAQSQATRDLQ